MARCCSSWGMWCSLWYVVAVLAVLKLVWCCTELLAIVLHSCWGRNWKQLSEGWIDWCVIFGVRLFVLICVVFRWFEGSVSCQITSTGQDIWFWFCIVPQRFLGEFIFWISARLQSLIDLNVNFFFLFKYFLFSFYYLFPWLKSILLVVRLIFLWPLKDMCRSTVVHSSSIPSKEQQNLASFKDRHSAEEVYNKNPRDSEGIPINISRTLQAQQRIPLGTIRVLPTFFQLNGFRFTFTV
jgi:hypothetical protein